LRRGEKKPKTIKGIYVYMHECVIEHKNNNINAGQSEVESNSLRGYTE
jgi:hypothetical protein